MMRKKVEDQLGVGSGFDENELKYEVTLEKVKHMVEDNPDAIAALFEALLSEEAEGMNAARTERR